MARISTLPLAAATVVLAACSTTLPPKLPASVVPSTALAHDAALACVDTINDRRQTAATRGGWRDGLAIVGGGLSLGAGSAATILEATGDDKSKKGVIVSASIAAAAGLVALIGNYVSDPTSALNERSKAVSNFLNGMSATTAASAQDAYNRCVTLAEPAPAQPAPPASGVAPPPPSPAPVF